MGVSVHDNTSVQTSPKSTISNSNKAHHPSLYRRAMVNAQTFTGNNITMSDRFSSDSGYSQYESQCQEISKISKENNSVNNNNWKKVFNEGQSPTVDSKTPRFNMFKPLKQLGLHQIQSDKI